MEFSQSNIAFAVLTLLKRFALQRLRQRWGVPTTVCLMNVAVAHSPNLISLVQVNVTTSNFGPYDASSIVLSEPQCTRLVGSLQRPVAAAVSTPCSR